MTIYDSLQIYRAHKEGSAVALGFFDGVHLGHRAVLKACAGSGLHRVVLTFSQPPAKTIGRACPPLLTDNARKAALLGELGAEDVIFADFASLRELSPAEFVRSILYERLHAKQVYCGFNYRFGKDGDGDTALLTVLCSEYGIGVTVIEPVYLDGEAVSSTRIRACIAAGEVGRAAEMLGGCYTIEGDIGGGNHIGTTMGFPTVNIPIGEGLCVPRYGVYAARITIDGRTFTAATNIGVHPTVEVISRPLCESFLLDFEGGDLYGKHAVCELRQFIRGERKFESIEELQTQIRHDCSVIAKL
ncbi:riboflavin biosynthesis protein RibF [uncultured Ruminococcus sp.]|uniref:riboflavin biosynthesis protein RibF n=1 Tax=uncultured Ruminococcus sp. TaxID=165186 RepID=UPI00292D7D9F|nr:riboflavin biosynthesis protein RibF [uncultured Ruminococcus sp.]